MRNKPHNLDPWTKFLTALGTVVGPIAGLVSLVIALLLKR